MTPEEKIEALRKWAKPADDYRLDGYYQAQCQVRDIIDPPAPQWRQWVMDQANEITGARATALEDILVCLAEIGYSAKGPLARIIAVCERQVGDGWRADPDLADFGNDQKTVMWLLESLVRYFEPVNYRRTGNRAAYWLRDLCDGGAE